MTDFFISLYPLFTEAHQQVVQKYLQSPRSLSKTAWTKALEAFDLLSLCVVTHKGRRRTFRGFYEEEIDKKYASLLITNLLKMKDVESEGAKYAFALLEQARADWEEKGFREPLTVEERLLLAFCTYWWGSFAKGYITEITIFRDLEKEGIQFQAHDLLSPAGRLSSSDLIVEGMEGDIKSSTYFLHTSRSFPLRHAFYITSLYNQNKREYLRVVVLKESAWHQINGETVQTTLEGVLSVFPRAGEISLKEQRLIVVEYELWKAKIKALQERKNE
ncbi:hypothetical protein FJZ31_15595 [Candidatus Poribacteria bacterium]|nr:hypothetical protein [Candidatus Poribacteria bacterium]